jgi:hypothetical protein
MQQEDEKDTKEDKERKKKKSKYERIRIEDIQSLRNTFMQIGWVKKDSSDQEKYAQMKSQIDFIGSNKTKFISDFFDKDPDLKEFVAIHSMGSTRKQFFTDEYILSISKRKVRIPRDEGLLSIIREFEGRPISFDRYPVSIVYNGDSFDIKDYAFDCDEEESKMQQWRKTPVLVL